MIRDSARLVRADVDATLGALADVTPAIDRAAVRLAREYADAIDRAAHTAEAIDALINRVTDALPWDDAQAIISELHRLAVQVKAEAVLASLGPKLLATLDALMATPRAQRAGVKPPAAPTGKTALQLIREASGNAG